MMAKRVPIDTYCEKKVATLQKTYDGLIDYVDISSVDNTEKKIISYQTIEASDAPSRAKQLLKKGDVLVSTVRPNLNAVAVIEEETENFMVGSTGYCVLRCKENMDVRYLFNFCQSQYFVDDMSSQATGASYPAVSNGIVRNSLIPCYSIEEQREIAEKMDTVSELLALKKQQLVELDELVKSRFVELFGDPVTNPMGWKKITVEQAINQKIIDKPLDGNHGGKHPKTSDYVPSGVPFIMANNLVDGSVDLINCAFISKKQADSLDKGFARDGDVLITHKGTIGRTAILHCQYPYIMLTPQVTYYRPIDGIIPEYLKAYFDTDYFQGIIGKIASIGSTRAYIGITAQQELPLVIPPMELQNQFAEFVKQTDKSKLAVQNSIAELEELKKSLMQKYFG